MFIFVFKKTVKHIPGNKTDHDKNIDNKKVVLKQMIRVLWIHMQRNTKQEIQVMLWVVSNRGLMWSFVSCYLVCELHYCRSWGRDWSLFWSLLYLNCKDEYSDTWWFLFAVIQLGTEDCSLIPRSSRVITGVRFPQKGSSSWKKHCRTSKVLRLHCHLLSSCL